MPIFKIKFKTELVSKLKSTIISVAISKKGPYGITLSLLLKYKINDNGNAIKLDKKIVNKLIQGPNTHPIKNINLISPPPRDSFLKIKLPNNISKYITIKDKKPYPKNSKALPNPLKIILAITIRIVKKTVTSSGITKKLESLTITITKNEETKIARTNSNPNPNIQ
jgi:hypothetical protein